MKRASARSWKPHSRGGPLPLLAPDARSRDAASDVMDAASPAALQRSRGILDAAFGVTDADLRASTRIRRLHQSGALKLRIPRLPGTAAEAVIVNTAGGLAGGDRLDSRFRLGPGASLAVTTQACERVYAALGDAPADVSLRLEVEAGASLRYLPQETILFDRARLHRRLEVECAVGASLLLAESVVLGREAMGERVTSLLLRERWRVRHGGRLVFAEELRLVGDAGDAAGRRAAVLNGARAFATLLWLGPASRPTQHEVRAMLGSEGGASEVNGVGIARLVAANGYALRQRLVPLLAALAGEALPRVWTF